MSADPVPQAPADIRAAQIRGIPPQDVASPHENADSALARQGRKVHMNETQLALRRLDRRQWHLWWVAFIVMVLLLVAVVSLSLPAVLKADDLFFQLNLLQCVRGLVALVLLFNGYAIYQQLLIRRVRLQLLAQVETTITLQVRTVAVQNLATLDPLTGLYNRRLFDERLAAEVTRSQRHGHPLSVLAFDLNDFKQINDGYGHGAGDLVLKEFADRLKRAIRTSDVAARTGGDEFLVLLPECHAGQVQHVLDRLEALAVDWDGKKIPFSFSAGWADYEAGEPIEKLLDRADQRMYADKGHLKSR